MSNPKKMHEFIWLFVGVAMILMSVFIDLEKLAFFVFIGAIFITVGAFKFFIKTKREPRIAPIISAAK